MIQVKLVKNMYTGNMLMNGSPARTRKTPVASAAPISQINTITTTLMFPNVPSQL